MESTIHFLRRTFEVAEKREDIRRVLNKQRYVYDTYGPLFAHDRIGSVEAEDLKQFVRYEENGHWIGIHRQINQITADMPHLREQLRLLTDPEQDLATRYDGAISSVPGMGRAVATAILHVSAPDEYGVWNNTSEAGLAREALLPDFDNSMSAGDKYAAVNKVFLSLSEQTGLDLWTIDLMWWYISMNPIQSGLQAVMQAYPQVRQTPFEKAGVQYKRLDAYLSDAAKAITLVINHEDDAAGYQAHYSIGSENWAAVPWVSVLRSDTPQGMGVGEYPVFLFSPDGDEVNLCFSQGVTNVLSDHRDREGEQNLQERATKIQAHLAKVGLEGFTFGQPENLGPKGTFGGRFAQGTAAYKTYATQDLPSEDDFVADLRSIHEARRGLVEEPTTMITELAAILSTYNEAATGPFGAKHESYTSLRDHFESIKRTLTSWPIVRDSKHLSVDFSIGQGKWSHRPFIYVRDDRQSVSGKKGLYVAIGFTEARDGYFVSLTQGTASVEKEYGSVEASSILAENSLELAKRCSKMKEAGYAMAGISDSQHPSYHLLNDAKIGVRSGPMEESPDADQELRSMIEAAITDYVSLAKSKATPGTKIWMIAPGQRAAEWDDWKSEGVVSIGWSGIGSLEGYASQIEIQEQLQEQDPEGPLQKINALACYQFAHEMAPGDLVIVKKGRHSVIGLGKVSGAYQYLPEQNQPHVRSVMWERIGSWKSPMMLPMKTLTQWTNYEEESAPLLALIRGGTEPSRRYTIEDACRDLFFSQAEVASWLQLLRLKKNIILQGPPGVGKTFAARRLAYALIGEKDFERAPIVQFHQSLTYEDFIQGYRPQGEEARFTLTDGTFVRFCEKAQTDSERKYVFVIDEINRANLSKVFGELLMLIEADKRGKEWGLALAYAGEDAPLFYVPDNVYLVGLMNTADRSLSMVDYALRRRFAFISLEPQFASAKFLEHLKSLEIPEGLRGQVVSRMVLLNQRIADDRARLGSGFTIGHSFFCAKDAQETGQEWFDRVVETEVFPLLGEYLSDMPARLDALKNILIGGDA